MERAFEVEREREEAAAASEDIRQPFWIPLLDVSGIPTGAYRRGTEQEVREIVAARATHEHGAEIPPGAVVPGAFGPQPTPDRADAMVLPEGERQPLVELTPEMRDAIEADVGRMGAALASAGVSIEEAAESFRQMGESLERSALGFGEFARAIRDAIAESVTRQIDAWMEREEHAALEREVRDNPRRRIAGVGTVVRRRHRDPLVIEDEPERERSCDRSSDTPREDPRPATPRRIVRVGS